jgi:hypothetical protein
VSAANRQDQLPHCHDAAVFQDISDNGRLRDECNLRSEAPECRRPEIALRARLLRGRVARARQRAARDFVQAYERELPAVAQCFTDSSLGGRAPPGIRHELRESSAAHAGVV